jgi:hypothetical protein
VVTLDSPTRTREPLAHISTEQIEDALRRTGGNLVQTAKKLGVGRSTLYNRIGVEPSLLATRDEIRESFVDEAEAAIVAAVRRGDVKAATFVLKTLVRARGYSTRLEIERTPSHHRSAGRRRSTAA